ncbi:MAG TPA: hypothetical protein VGD08_09780 [Stellaceae bacterium]
MGYRRGGCRRTGTRPPSLFRQAFERRFTARRMAEHDLRLYRRLAPAATPEAA